MAYVTVVHVCWWSMFHGRCIVNNSRLRSTMVTNLDWVGRTSSDRDRVVVFVFSSASATRIRYVDSPWVFIVRVNSPSSLDGCGQSVVSVWSRRSHRKLGTLSIIICVNICLACDVALPVYKHVYFRASIKIFFFDMDQLSQKEQERIRKMSDKRLSSSLSRAGVDLDEIEGMDINTMIDMTGGLK